MTDKLSYRPLAVPKEVKDGLSVGLAQNLEGRECGHRLNMPR